MRFLVDFNIGTGIVEYLRQMDHDTTYVGDVDPRMSDVDILAWAVQEQRIVVTMDKDFGELVYHSGHPHAGVLLLRLSSSTRAEKLHVIEWILDQHASDLSDHFCVFEAGHLRIR